MCVFSCGFCSPEDRSPALLSPALIDPPSVLHHTNIYQPKSLFGKFSVLTGIYSRDSVRNQHKRVTYIDINELRSNIKLDMGEFGALKCL